MNDSSGLSIQQIVLFSLCSAFPERPGLGTLPFLLCSSPPQGFIVPWKIQTPGFTVHIHFMKRDCKPVLCPWETDPVGWREGWSWDTEELGREEMLLSLLKTLQPVVQNLLSDYCPVPLLPSIPHAFHAQA